MGYQAFPGESSRVSVVLNCEVLMKIQEDSLLCESGHLSISNMSCSLSLFIETLEDLSS